MIGFEVDGKFELMAKKNGFGEYILALLFGSILLNYF